MRTNYEALFGFAQVIMPSRCSGLPDLADVMMMRARRAPVTGVRQLRRKLHDWFLAALGICAGILSPIAILVLLSAAFIPWWEATLSKHRWLTVVLVLIVLSRWLVGGLLYCRVGASTMTICDLPKASGAEPQKSKQPLPK